LPAWPITRLRRRDTAPSETPAAVMATVQSAHGVRRLATVSAEAEALGLHPGQTLADARAIHPALVAAEEDPQADLQALAHLATWCERYTPLAAADAPEGVWLDITGCAHLWGGEDGLLTDLSTRLARNRLPCRIAIAGSTGAAWALTHAPMSPARTIIPPNGERAALAALPVAVLRLEPRTVAGLRRLGLKTVADLGRLPRAELTARFGPRPVLRLDQSMGAAEEAIAWPRPPAPWTERIAFAEPIGTAEDLRRTIVLLAERLCMRLAAQDLGGQIFTARFFRSDGETPRITIATAQPVHDPAYVAKLLSEKLEKVDPGFGVDVVSLEAEETALQSATQTSLDSNGDTQRALSALVDHLTNRLGPEKLWRVAPYASHVPERAVQRASPLNAPPVWDSDHIPSRPIRLLRRPESIDVTALLPDDPPVHFHWRRSLHRVRAATGPERIAAEWWRRAQPDDMHQTDLVRDYYRVETTEGARFWIFRSGLRGYVRAPRWYLHGLFS